jgi:hypothetical protein
LHTVLLCFENRTSRAGSFPATQGLAGSLGTARQ